MEDLPKQKPRIAYGTPLFKFLTKISLGIVIGSHAIGAAYLYFEDKRLDRFMTSGSMDQSKFHIKQMELLATSNSMYSSPDSNKIAMHHYERSVEVDMSSGTHDVDFE